MTQHILGSQKGALILLLASTACVSSPEIYEPTKPYYVGTQGAPADGPQIEPGAPIPLLDGLNHLVLSLPSKILLWNWRLMDHELSARDRQVLEHYLALNQLTAVKVRHNQYAPWGELQRLVHNHQVGAGYRYSLGLITWLRYTLLPDRILGGLPLVSAGDHFNPYTNTINVFSSDLPVLIHEAGHAKDYVEHDSRGTSVGLARLLPGVDLFQEARASTDAIRFFYCVQELDAELRAYKVLIPAYSTYIAGYFEGGLVVTLPLVLAGHIAGRAQAEAREREIAELPERPDFRPSFCAPIGSPDGERHPEQDEAI